MPSSPWSVTPDAWRDGQFKDTVAKVRRHLSPVSCLLLPGLSQGPMEGIPVCHPRACLHLCTGVVIMSAQRELMLRKGYDWPEAAQLG